MAPSAHHHVSLAHPRMLISFSHQCTCPARFKRLCSHLSHLFPLPVVCALIRRVTGVGSRSRQKFEGVTISSFWWWRPAAATKGAPQSVRQCWHPLSPLLPLSWVPFGRFADAYCWVAVLQNTNYLQMCRTVLGCAAACGLPDHRAPAEGNDEVSSTTRISARRLSTSARKEVLQVELKHWANTNICLAFLPESHLAWLTK